MPGHIAAQHAPQALPAAWDDALPAFLDYLASYRGYSSHTVKAHARDLREFREFLAAQRPAVGRPDQVQRQMVVQYALSLRGAAPLRVRRKLAGISSFFVSAPRPHWRPKRAAPRSWDTAICGC